MADIINRFKSFFLSKTVLVRLILINIAVFIAVHLFVLVSSISGSGFSITGLLELQPDFLSAAMHPWGFVTYMFVHYDLLHILFNMLWLYCFGIVFLDNFSNKEFIAVYIAGGLAGAVFYLSANTLFSHMASAGLLGSSAAVLSVAAATVVRAPNYRFNLFLIGMVKIKWIAVACIAISLLTTSIGNIGSHSAHLGGIVAGILFAATIRKKSIMQNRGRRKKGIVLPPLHKIAPSKKEPSQQEINEALDQLLIKVKQSGYNSLSEKEKKKLSELSNRLKI